MAHRTLLTSLAGFFLVAGFATSAHADDDPDLSDAETSYKGAQILEGDYDVVLGGSEIGSIGDPDDMSTYAFFAGNTLYAGAEDLDGNSMDMIGEFFWFESSIDRNSDFYVGVFKVRNSPNLTEYELNVEDDPVISVYAETDLSEGTGAFRWDWSLPFENYGIDSYGDATLTTSYGAGLNAEGSLMSSETVNEEGDTESSTVQAKGFVNADYKVQAQYQVTLWRWEVDVHGTPGSMQWDMYLNTGDRKDQNAYHEFFLVMQSEEDVPFVMDYLEIGGTVTDQWWWWLDPQLSVALTDITLYRPETDEDDPDGDDDDDDDGDDDDDADDDDDDLGDDDGHNDDVNGAPRGDLRDMAGNTPLDEIDDGVDHNGVDGENGMTCSTATTTAASPLAGTLLCGLVLWMARRRS